MKQYIAQTLNFIRASCLVDLNVPLLLGLKSLQPLVVVQSLLVGNALEHVLDSGHHSLKTTEVDVGTVLKLLEDLVGVFLNLVLDVHLSSVLVFLFSGKSIVETEVVRELLLGLLELVIIKKGVTVGNTKEQPGFSLVGIGGRGVLSEKTADESTVRGNSGSGGNHDVVSVGVFFGHKHNLSRGSSHLDFVTRLGVAQKVGADSLLGGVLGLEVGAPVGGTTDAKGSSLSGHIISISGRGDGVKTNRVGLSILLTVAWGDYSPGLSLPVREVTIMVDDNVASLTSGLGSDNSLSGDNLSGERSLVLVSVDRNSGLVIVRLGFKEVLLCRSGSTVKGKWLG